MNWNEVINETKKRVDGLGLDIPVFFANELPKKPDDFYIEISGSQDASLPFLERIKYIQGTIYVSSCSIRTKGMERLNHVSNKIESIFEPTEKKNSFTTKSGIYCVVRYATQLPPYYETLQNTQLVDRFVRVTCRFTFDCYENKKGN